MTRLFSRLLILLKIILYSKYESRHKRRHEGSMLALIRRLILSQKAQVQGSLSGHIGRPPDSQSLSPFVAIRNTPIDLSHSLSHLMAIFSTLIDRRSSLPVDRSNLLSQLIALSESCDF